VGREGGCIALGSVSSDGSRLRSGALPWHEPSALAALEDQDRDWDPNKGEFSPRPSLSSRSVVPRSH